MRLDWTEPSYACDISDYVISALPGLSVDVTVNSTLTYYYLNVNSTNQYYPMIRARDSERRPGNSTSARGRCFALDGE